MKSNKGFTLLELIVSFILIAALSLALFRTVLSIQRIQKQNIFINQFKSLSVILNNEIQNDFYNDAISDVLECGTNCYDITYKGKGTVRLSIDRENNTIRYGSIKEKLPEEYVLYDDLDIEQYTSETSGYNSYFILNIPIKSGLDANLNGLKYIYMYDSTGNQIDFVPGQVYDASTYSELEQRLLLALYPKNSIYISLSNTNPTTLFGGTWELLGSGRKLVGVDTSNSLFNTLGKTGGSSSVSYTPSGTVGDHTLTIAEIPSHTHTYETGRWSWAEEAGGNNIINSQSETSIRFTRTSGATGGGEAHNHPFTGTASTINVQDPYITVYMWKRAD